MKKLHRARDFLAGVLVTALVVSLSVPAMAALTSKKIEVLQGVEIYVDGVKMNPTDANGDPVETFVYNGTTYVPIRAVSQYLNKTVDWDGANQRVYIGEVPGQKQYLLDVCPPYQTSNYYSTPSTITMGGVKYANGFIVKDIGGWYTLFNLNGQYNSLHFVVGHRDGMSTGNITLNIYLDNHLEFSIDLTSEMLPQYCDIDLHGALQMKIEVTGGINCYYGIADIQVE